MTSIRQSFLFTLEDSFKGGKGKMSWIAPPPGSYFSNTSSRQTSTIYSTGSKKWDVTAYGAFAGSWEWTFMLDYEYLEPLMLAFDSVDGNVYATEGDTAQGDSFGQNLGATTHTFAKGRVGRVPSFCIRRKILNRIAGGPDNSDELTELYGCVVQSISFARSATSSQYQVSMSGTYADERLVLGSLDATDYQPYTGRLVEYSCMLLGDTDESTVETAVYVANTDSISVSINNNTSMINNTCTPIPSQYYEGTNQFQISTSCYSNDPETYKLRVYGGGKKPAAGSYYAPMTKGLQPLPKMFIASYDGGARTDNPDDSVCKVLFTVTDAVVKSMKWVNGDGSKLTDSLSSVDCRNITLTITNESHNLITHTAFSSDVVNDGIQGHSVNVNGGAITLTPDHVAPVLLYMAVEQSKSMTDTSGYKKKDSTGTVTTYTYAEYLKEISKGFQYVASTTQTSDAQSTLNHLVVSPNLTDADAENTLTVSSETASGTSDSYLGISGTATRLGTEFYYVADLKRGVHGVLRVDIVPLSG